MNNINTEPLLFACSLIPNTQITLKLDNNGQVETLTFYQLDIHLLLPKS